MEVVESIAAGARLAQYAGAMLLLGSPLFMLRNLDEAQPWTRRVLWAGLTLVLLGGASLALAQTAMMFGENAAALRPADVASVLTDTQMGRGLALRLALAATCAIVMMFALASRTQWGLVGGIGAAITATFAWTGHGAATEGGAGYVHLASDIVHALAAAVWLGALPPLLILIRRAQARQVTPSDIKMAHAALEGFAGVGSFAVALLIVTGAINSWFLVGAEHLNDLGASLYGRLLIAKLVLFALMLALAATNRFRLTPALRGRMTKPNVPLQNLRLSVAVETLAAIAVLALVAWLGMLTPPAAE